MQRWPRMKPALRKPVSPGRRDSAFVCSFGGRGLELLLRSHKNTMYISPMVIHNRIVVLRAERKLSRAQLATQVGVNTQTIGFLERGDYTPSLELAFKISRFFKLPMEAVFSPDPFRPLSEQVYTLEKREA
jgi:putative transcriptional regulator